MASASDTRKAAQRGNDEIEEGLDAIEKLLDRTKVMFEQYFMGIQKLPPSQLHSDLERRIRDQTQVQIRNTGLRFRFNTIQQKYGSYNSYWRRVLRQIEQGTYARDIQRVSRKAARNGEDVPEELLVKLPKRIQDRIRRDRAAVAEAAVRAGKAGPLAVDGDAAVAVAATAGGDAGGLAAGSRPPGEQRPGVFTLDADDLDDGEIDGMFAAMTSAGAPAPAGLATARAATPSSPPAPRPPPPRPTTPPARASGGPVPPPGMSEKQCRELYARYVKARELVGQSNADMSYDKLVASLGKQAPVIMKEHGARGVEFNVVVKGDKVVLKAKPQK